MKLKELTQEEKELLEFLLLTEPHLVDFLILCILNQDKALEVKN